MGTGVHGGFGNSFGRKHSLKLGKIHHTNNNYTRESLINEIDGHTVLSTKIASGIKNGDIHINVLGDRLFEEYLGYGKNTIAVTIGKQIYLRSSSASIISDLIHEGTHVLDHLSGINSQNIGRIKLELRAYKAERDFQIKTNRKVDFPNEDDIYVHVHRNYKKGN